MQSTTISRKTTASFGPIVQVSPRFTRVLESVFVPSVGSARCGSMVRQELLPLPSQTLTAVSTTGQSFFLLPWALTHPSAGTGIRPAPYCPVTSRRGSSSRLRKRSSGIRCCRLVFPTDRFPNIWDEATRTCLHPGRPRAVTAHLPQAQGGSG
jgi:hypothetical protein